jgi:outer membrane lipase/esterase
LKGSLAALLFWATSALALPYSNLVVFGDSLADSGNNYLATGRPDRRALERPDGADLSLRVRSLQQRPGVDRVFRQQPRPGPRASLLGGNNYAFGGARVAGASPVPTLQQQVGLYLSANTVSANTLYVIEGGGNDARDVLDLLMSGQDPTQRIADYVLGMVDMIGTLAGLGANHFLVWNITDLGLVPAVTAQVPAAAQARAVSWPP